MVKCDRNIMKLQYFYCKEKELKLQYMIKEICTGFTYVCINNAYTWAFKGGDNFGIYKIYDFQSKWF
jgi:hypothetical protein